MHDDKVKAALAAMRARCEAATPGQWVVRGQRVESIAEVAYCPISCAATRNASQSIDAYEAEANARFTAAAHTDVPKLIAVADAAQRASEAERVYRVANDKYRAARWGRLTLDTSVVAEAKAAHEAARKEGREARKALKAALAALGEP